MRPACGHAARSFWGIALKDRIAWLDLFRGLAAIMILLYHYRGYLGLPGFDFGFLAVDGFFILSGIVLAMKYTDAIAEGMSFGAFAAARFKRLYPMIFLAGLFVVLLNIAEAPHNVIMWAEPNGVWTVFLVLIPSIGGLTTSTDAAFPPDIPMWSLWAELVVNGIWFAVVRVRRQWMPMLSGLAMFALVVILALQISDLNHGWENSVGTRLFSFIRALTWFNVGYLIARTKLKPLASPLVWTLALCGVFIASIFGLPLTWYTELGTVALSAALLHALNAAPAPGRVLSNIARVLGAASFPFYLIHGPAGRLLTYFGHDMPHFVVLLLLMVPITAIATVLNEWAVGRVHQHWRAESWRAREA